MGKRIISQARGKGSLTYRVKKKAFTRKIGYPRTEGEAQIIKLVHSPAHSAPLIKISLNKESFFLPAFNLAFEEQKIKVGGTENKTGNILLLKNIKVGKEVYNIERNPGDGGKFMRSAGSAAIVSKKLENGKISVS